MLNNTLSSVLFYFFFFQAEDGIRDSSVTGVQTCALPIWYLDLPGPFGDAILSEGQRVSRGQAISLDRERLRPGGCHRERHCEDSAPAGAGHDGEAGPRVLQAVECHQREPGTRRAPARKMEATQPGRG